MRKTEQSAQNVINFRNLKQIPTGNDTIEIIKKSQNRHQINKNKQDIIHETIEKYLFHIILITETWLKKQDDDIWIMEGTTCSQSIDHIKNKGGIALIITDHLTVGNITQNTNHTQYRSFEHIMCTVQSG